MQDVDIIEHINLLIAREHLLREKRSNGGVDGAEVIRELAHAEVELDRCWDLLRQREAKREFGNNPDDAELRPEAVVESYWQ